MKKEISFVLTIIILASFFPQVCAMNIGPFEVTRYRDVVACRIGNFGFFISLRNFLLEIALVGFVGAYLGCSLTSGLIFCPPLLFCTTFLSMAVFKTLFLAFTSIRSVLDAFISRELIAEMRSSPVLGDLSTAELFYWISAKKEKRPVPPEIDAALSHYIVS